MEMHLISLPRALINLRFAGCCLEKPASLPFTWGRKWCRNGELGRESLWAELRLLVRRKDLCTPGDSSSVQQGPGAGQDGDRKEEQKLTQEQGPPPSFQGREKGKKKNKIKNINQESENRGRKRG